MKTYSTRALQWWICVICACSAGCTAPSLIEESFSGGQIAPGLRVVSGVWSIDEGALGNSEDGGGLVLLGDEQWGDYSVEVRLRTVRAGSKQWSTARLFFRYAGPGNCYYVLLHRNRMLELGKEQNGQHQPSIASASECADPLEWNRLRIVLEGSRIRVSVNGELRIDYVDPEPLASGRIGLEGFQRSVVRFDDLCVQSEKIMSEAKLRRRKVREAACAKGLERSRKGNIAVFRDEGVPVVESAPSDPVALAKLLEQAGYGVAFLDAKELADAVLLDRENFDAVLLPYGAAFPAKAVSNFRRFLRDGGGFVSMGGYFADHLYDQDGATADANLLTNPRFEKGLAGWEPNHGDVDGVEITAAPELGRAGGPAARIRVDQSAPVTYYSILQKLDAPKADNVLRAGAMVTTRGVADGAGAYVALNYYREDGTRIKWDQSVGVRGDRQGGRLKLLGRAPAGTAYATMNLILHGHGEAVFEEVQLRASDSDVACLNTREGDIKGPGNSLRVQPEQIGVFDPGYRLENVAELRASADQSIVEPSFRIPITVNGYSASGLFIGNGNPVRAVTHARPVMLADAFDSLGRKRGCAGALVRNYRGVYAGSNWAVFGVNNADLFSTKVDGSRKLLLDTVQAVLRRVFIAEVHTEYACYRPGEAVRLQALVANYGPRSRTARLRFRIRTGPSDAESVFAEKADVRLTPGGTTEVEATWSPDEFRSDFYTVSAELVRSRRTVDSMESGFVVWKDEVVRRGPTIAAGNAYLNRNGRSVFLCGTGDSGYPYYAETENPLVWDEQFRLMRDFGLSYYRCMHFFSFDLPERLVDARDLPQKQLRRLDALVYLAHKHGLMFLFVNNVGLQLARDNPEELAKRKKALRLIAERYVDARAFVFNMDHQEFIRGDKPEVHAAFREFLKRRYGTYSKLAAAWGLGEEGDFADLKFDEGKLRQLPWDSRAARDGCEFLHDYREAWRRNASEAIHKGNRDAVYDQDFSLYWLPDFQWPAPETMQKLGVVSTHFYGDAKRFPMQNKRADMQVLGKPVGQTEFGTLTHPAWTGHVDARLDADAADAFFMMAGHYCLGLGATMMSNWNWKEMKECIFPWAIAYHDLVPKEHLRAYRNMALLFNSFAPKYTHPEVYVVLPGAHLLSNKVHQVDAAVRDCIRRLMSCHVRFGIIGESYLDRLPPEAKALFYPIPFCPNDEVFDDLVRFVERGGCLYFSGDISFDSDKSRTRTPRLKALAGVEFAAENFQHIDIPRASRGVPAIVVKPAGARVIANSERGPRIVVSRLAEGWVVFCIDPVEVYGGEAAVDASTLSDLQLPTKVSSNKGKTDAYSLALDLAGVERLPVAERDPQVHVFRVATAEGGTVYTLYNSADDARDLTLRHDGRELAIRVDPGRTALAHFGSGGELLAVECQSGASLDGRRIWHGQAHFILVSLSGESVEKAERLLVMSIGQGEAGINVQSRSAPATIQYGEFRDGRWKESRSVRCAEAVARVETRGALRSAMALVCPKDEVDKAAREAERLLAR